MVELKTDQSCIKVPTYHSANDIEFEKGGEVKANGQTDIDTKEGGNIDVVKPGKEAQTAEMSTKSGKINVLQRPLSLNN